LQQSGRLGDDALAGLKRHSQSRGAAMVKLDHLRITVENWRASRDWYVGNFGFKVEFEVPEGGVHKRGVVALQDDAGFTVFLEQTDNAVYACDCIYYFQVGNVDDEFRALSSKGVRFLQTPQQLYWGYGAELVDPDGHTIRIWDERSMKNK
jgi:predicted enzyme related to lactoylglutathione lyase